MVKLHSPLLLPTFKVFMAHLGVSLDYTLHFVKSVVFVQIYHHVSAYLPSYIYLFICLRSFKVFTCWFYRLFKLECTSVILAITEL